MRKLLALVALAVLATPVWSTTLSVSIVKGTAATGTPTFTQDLTDSTTFAGATPKAAIVFSSKATAENTTTGGGLTLSMGFVAGGHEAGIGIFDNDAVSTGTAARVGHDTQGYSVQGASGATDGDANLSLIANGVRLSWTDQSIGEIVHAILIGGSVEANVVTKVSGNTTSAQTITHGLTGTPDFIIALQPGAIGNNVEATGNAHFGAGFWTSAAQQTLAYIANQTGQTSVTASQKLDSTHAIGLTGAASMTWTGLISNVGATTFDLTSSTANTNVMYFLVVRSTSGSPLVVKSGTFTPKASTGNQADVSGMSNQPVAFLSFQSQLTALDTFSSTTPADTFGIGAAVVNTGSGATQYAVAAASDRDGLATSGTHAFTQSSNTEDVRILSFDGTADIEATVNSWDAGGLTHNYTNIANTAGQGEMAYLAFGVTATAPVFSAAPSVSSTTSGGYVLAATANTAANWYEVAVPKGSTAPTCTQVKAGQNGASGAALGAVNKAVTGADSQTITGILVPTTDLYGCLSNGAGDSTVSALTDQFKSPAAGKQYERLTSVSGTSFCNSISSPAVAAPDIVEIDSVTTPDADAISILADCNLSFPSDGSRNSAQYQIYDDSVRAFMTGGPGTLWFNNQAPTCATTTEILIVPAGSAMSPLDLSAFCTDPDADAVTVTAIDAPPTGLSVSASTLSGTATTPGIYANKVMRGTDVPGDSDDFTVTYLVGNLTIPNEVGVATAQAQDDLATAYFASSITSVYSKTVAPGTVISQTPTGTAAPFTTVALTVSRGQAPQGTGWWRFRLTPHGMQIH